MAVPNGYIISAYYGGVPSGSAPGFNDVTALVASQFGSGTTSFTASNQNYGPDPAPGVVKTLLITYAWTNATSLAAGIYPLGSFCINTVAIAENNTVTLPSITN